MMKLRTGRLRKLRRLIGPPTISPEMKRSVDRPPSRLRAWRTFHGAGDAVASAWARAARVHEEVFPTHQRVPPSLRIIERSADFPESRPPTGFRFSMRSGPAWMSSWDPAMAAREVRRMMEDFPEKFSKKMPLPREEAEFHAPELRPFEITSPRGFPSGVKKPALMASKALLRRARSSALW